MKISNNAKYIHRCVRSQSYEFLAETVDARMQSHRRRHWTLQSRPQWATRQVYPTDKMLMLLKRHFSGGREVEQVKLEEKTSRKKSDESVLSLREVTKYVVLTESRRPSISEYFRTLVSKMTINDALS